MRIQSHFHDYYDSLLKQGFESDRLYLRKTLEWNKSTRDYPQDHPKPPAVLTELQAQIPVAARYMNAKHLARAVLSPSNTNYPKNTRLILEPMAFVAAGSVIPAVWVRLEKMESTRLYYGIDNDTVVPLNEQGAMDVYTREARRRRNSEPKEETKTQYLCNEPIFDLAKLEHVLPEEWHNIIKQNNDFQMARVRQWFEHTLRHSNQSYNALSDSNVLLAVLTKETIVQNPQLQHYKFPKYWDPHTCMQELSMFIGNMAAPDRVPVVIEDKYRIEQHGFDAKSFRKQPTKNATPARRKRPHPDRPVDGNESPSPDMM